MFIDVLSPATATRDLHDKKALYEKHGVAEYIVVNPLEHYAMRFVLGGDGLYDKGTVVGGKETLLVPSTICRSRCGKSLVFAIPKQWSLAKRRRVDAAFRPMRDLNEWLCRRVRSQSPTTQVAMTNDWLKAHGYTRGKSCALC